tara:strand:- start:11689 stop:12519 length:831 start_codon:yes stop_codon:yes gene_type:complete
MRLIIKILLIIIYLNSTVVSQVKQVTMQISLAFNIPYVGPINRLEKFVFGTNIRHSIERLEADRYYARLFVNDSKGKIIDANNHSYYKYNIKDKEYWEVPFEKALYNKHIAQTNKKRAGNKQSSWSMSFSDEANPVVDVSRINNNDVTIFEKQSEKWVTTYTKANGNRLVLEEWSVQELPVLRLADSLNRALELKLGKPDSIIVPFGIGFSNLILNNNPNYHDPIPGEIIKAHIRSYENKEDEPNFSMKMELISLDIENFDLNQFSVPNNYKEVKR